MGRVILFIEGGGKEKYIEYSLGLKFFIKKRRKK
jgi:hypothetical protein